MDTLSKHEPTAARIWQSPRRNFDFFRRFLSSFRGKATYIGNDLEKTKTYETHFETLYGAYQKV